MAPSVLIEPQAQRVTKSTLVRFRLLRAIEQRRPSLFGWLSDSIDRLAGVSLYRRLNHSSERGNSAWLVSMPFDLLFVCGLAPWIFGSIAYCIVNAVTGSSDVSAAQWQLTVFFAAISLLIGESHQFTSIVRYYCRARTRKAAYKLDRIPFWCIYFGLSLLGLFLLADQYHWQPMVELLTGAGSVIGTPIAMLLGAAVMLFPVVLLQHVCAQATSIGFMYFYQGNYALTRGDKQLVRIISWLLTMTGACTIAKPFGFFDVDVPVVGLEQLSEQILKPALVSLSTIAVVIALLHFAIKWLCEKEPVPLGAALTWLNLALFILVPSYFMLGRIPAVAAGGFVGSLMPAPDPAATAAPAVVLPSLVACVSIFVPVLFHASQHWAVAWQRQESERLSETATDVSASGPRRRSLFERFSDVCWLILPVQAVTLVVLFLSLVASSATKSGAPDSLSLIPTLPLGWSMLVFYLHYFADRVVWRPS